MAGLTPTGWVSKSLQELLAELESDERSTIDAGLDTSAFSLLGQLNGVYASKLAELWELGGQLYDMLDADAVNDAQQDALYSLTGTLRRAATKSRVTATVTLAPTTSIGIGEAVASVLGNPGARFVNIEPMASTPGGDVDVLFEAEQAGPTIANAGTLTVIETPITGWTAITNELDAEAGKNIESDAAFRVRRLAELASPGGSTLAGIRADLMRIPTVRAANVLENVKGYVQDGMPSHSFEAIVRSVSGSEDDAAIAASIWKNKAAGIATHGTTTLTVTDPVDGSEHAVHFSRPTEVPVYIAIEVDTTTGEAPSLAAAIKAASIDRTNPSFLDVGTTVYAGRIVCTAVEVPGVLNARVGLSLEEITDPDAGADKLAINSRSIAVIDSSRIHVTVLT